VIDAPTEERFDQLYCDLKVSYAESPVIMTYIEDNMMPKKEEFAEYICKCMPGFGQRTASRLESSHGRLKRALLNRLGHPNDIVKDIHQLIRKDRNIVKAEIDAAEIRITSSVNITHFAKLHNMITPPGLALLKGQLDFAKDPAYVDGTCSKAFSSKYDLLCKHELYRMWKFDQNFQLTPLQIGTHWWFYPSRKAQDRPAYPKDSAVAKPKGRPKGAKGKGKGTADDPFRVQERDPNRLEFARASQKVLPSSQKTPRTSQKRKILAEEEPPGWF
jgi:hypothetical protein